MGVHVRPAELHIVRAMSPEKIILPLPATPGIRPWPPSGVVTDIVGRSDGNAWQLVVDVCLKEVWHVTSGRLLIKAHVINVEIVAVEVERSLVQQGCADGVGGAHHTLPGGDSHRRTHRR